MTAPIPDEMVEAVAAVLRDHHDQIWHADTAMSGCTCGGWSRPFTPDGIGERAAEHRRHVARAVLEAALSVCWVRQQHGVALDEQAVSACHSYCTNDDHERDRVRLVIQTPWREVP